MDADAAVTVNNVVKSYGTVKALQGVSFVVPKGEIFGILGPNGAGKTTLIKCILQLLTPDNGSISVLGQNSARGLLEAKQYIGVVHQRQTIDLFLSAFENVRIYGVLHGLSLKESTRRAEELLNLFDMNDRCNRNMEFLSGGETRKVQIARALIHNPRLLFLDEPTAGLDPGSRKDFWNLLIQEQKRSDMTVILTTHYVEEADAVCDRVAVLNQGKIVAIDTPQSLKAQIGKQVMLANTSDNDAAAQAIPGAVVVGNQLMIDMTYVGMTLSEIVTQLSETNIKVSIASVRESTLEDVFLKLTGRIINE